MKNIIFVLFVLIITGCMWQDVDYKALRAAKELCVEHNGVLEITAYYDGRYSVICVTGKYIVSADMSELIYKHEMEAVSEINKEGKL